MRAFRRLSIAGLVFTQVGVVAAPKPVRAPAQAAVTSQDKSIPDFEDRLKAAYGLDANQRDSIDPQALLKALDAERAKHEGKDHRTQRELLTQASEIVKAAVASESTAKRSSGVLVGLRILYGVWAIDLEDGTGLAPEAREESGESRVDRLRKRTHQLRNSLLRAKRLFLSERVSSLPFVDKVDALLDATQAKAEAQNLVDESGTRHLSPEDFVGKSHEWVSDQDIGEGHPVWHTERYRQEHPDGFKDWEDFVGRRLTEELRGKNVLGATESYAPSEARRVLVLDAIKNSATSPKVRAKDVYGQSWSLKWGDEIQTEPVVNRLWMKLGGKTTDLVYVSGRGAEELVLVLPKAGGTGCETPSTLDAFEKCLMESKFTFNVKPYLDSSGTLTTQNVATILAKVPAAQRAAYVGRVYVTFKEASQELRPSKNLVLRGGAASYSALGANEDRVARGLALFNYWIANIDAKDENNVGSLIANASGGRDYVETQHDMGASLGGVVSVGQVNELSTGEDFVSLAPGGGPSKFLSRFKNQKQLYFKDPMLYHPTSWENATYADGLWMARKILSLSRADIEEIVSVSRWPLFMQRALAYKLIARRNEIARYFDPSGSKLEGPELPIVADLSTPEARARVLAREGFASGEDARAFEAYVKAQKLPTPKSETLVDANGQVAFCPSSLVVGFLQRRAHPTGLAPRISRLHDGEPGDERGCEYGAPPPPSEMKRIIDGFLGK